MRASARLGNSLNFVVLCKNIAASFTDCSWIFACLCVQEMRALQRACTALSKEHDKLEVTSILTCVSLCFCQNSVCGGGPPKGICWWNGL
jgi:hypothetical protein